jgi:pyruvate dehydrogenase E2 component (dihydrolipoamide acetyltransferase)
VPEFLLPDVGEGLTEAEVVSWKVQPGDEVVVNQVLVEIETAKSLVELPSPFAGTVSELLVAEGTTVPVGTPLVRVGGPDASAPAAPGGAATTTGAPAAGSGSEPAEEKREPVLVGYGPRAARRRRRHASPAATPGTAALHGAFSTGHEVGVRVAPPEPPHPVSPVVPAPDAPAEPLPAVGEFPPEPPAAGREPAAGRPLAKPPVRRLARVLGVSLAEVVGTGSDGTITRDDVEAHAAAAAAGTAVRPTGGAAPGPAHERLGWDGLPRTERLPVRGVRRETANAVVRSAFTAPHVTQMLTVDVTESMLLLERLKADRRLAGVRLSPLTLAARAMCLAARRTPEVTAVWHTEAAEIELRRYVDLAVATATPRGLLVPVVHDADRLDLVALGTAIADLADRAREGRTTPAESSGGTLAVTNIGVFGMDAGTPIMPPGISAILALGQVARRPWVMTRDGVETVEPRWVTTLALSFDHRLIDGAQGSSFMRDVASLLSDPALALALA